MSGTIAKENIGRPRNIQTIKNTQQQKNKIIKKKFDVRKQPSS